MGSETPDTQLTGIKKGDINTSKYGATASKNLRVVCQQHNQSSITVSDSHSTEIKKRERDSTTDGAPASKRQRLLRQQHKRASKMRVLRVAYGKLQNLAEHGGRPISVLLNFLTAKKLRCQLRAELRGAYWQDPASLKAPWERYFSTEDRPLRHLIGLRNKDTGLALSTDQVAFEHELSVCRIPSLKK